MLNASRAPCRLGLVGPSGRMGQRVLSLLPAHPHISLSAVLVRQTPAPTQAALKVHDDVMITTDAEAMVAAVDVVLDFSAPACCQSLAPLCVAGNVAYVVASTGLNDAQEDAITAASQHIPVLQAANLSLGVDVLRELVEQAAQRLADWDIEIVEVHHRHKQDGPSGTAYALGQAVQKGAGPMQTVLSRHAEEGARGAKTLGYSVVRGGDVPGEHTVLFLGTGERLELTHRSQTADIFARGALDTCAKLVTRAPGRYTMASLSAPAA